MAHWRSTQCSHCGNVYLADSDFCRHCGQKREDVDAFRQYCSEVISGVSENLCTHYEREIQQLTTDLVNCRSQLSRCAGLLSQQLDKEKTYRDIIQKLAESSLRVLQTTPPSLDEAMKQQLHDMLEAMHVQNSSLFEDGFGQLHEHKRLAETHLMTSAELQNQGEAIKKELDSIMDLLKEPPVRVAKFQLAQPQGLGNGSAVQSATKVPQRSEQRSEVCTLVSSVMIFIPLRIYAYVSLASLVALLMASMCFLGDLSTISTAKWSYPELQLEPHVGNFFRAYGLFIFCFAGHPCLPALHEGMQHTERWTGCVSWSFSIAAVYYLVLGLVTYLAHGDDLHPVFTKDMSIPWLKHTTAAFFAVKIQLTTPVLMRVVLQSMQIWPEGRHVNEFIQNSLPVALVILLTGTSACFLAGEVAALASFVGALLVNLTSIVIPCVMYARLSVWSQQPGKNKVKLVMCGVLVVFGLVTAVAGTYLAVLDMTH